MKDLSEFKVKLPENLNPILLEEREEVGRNINLYLSDLHLGAALTTGSLYKENIKYGLLKLREDSLKFWRGFINSELLILSILC